MVREGLELGNSSLIQLTGALTRGCPLARGEYLWEMEEELSIAGGGERCQWSWGTGGQRPPQPPGVTVSRGPCYIPDPQRAAEPQHILTSWLAAPH